MVDPLGVREIKYVHSKVEPLQEAVPTDDADLRGWLKSKACTLRSVADKFEVYLISFHDDGVVWGKSKSSNGADELLTSDSLSNSPSPSFRAKTLQECRLFSRKGELLVWRVAEGIFKSRLIEDDEDAPQKEAEFFDEQQVLWGTRTESNVSVSSDFTVVADGSEGLRHAFPQMVQFNGNQRPLRLCVRHYLAYDEDGCAYINLSRLLNVDVK